MTTNDADLAERVRSLRHHGWSPSDRYDDMPAAGFNYRLPDILCAVGIPQLARLEELLAAPRARSPPAMRSASRDLPVVLPGADEGDRHGWQAYVIQLDRRDEAMAALRAQGIQCQIGTYALHRLSAYRDQGELPRRGRLLRARARAAAAHAADRRRARPRRGGLDSGCE